MKQTQMTRANWNFYLKRILMDLNQKTQTLHLPYPKMKLSLKIAQDTAHKIAKNQTERKKLEYVSSIASSKKSKRRKRKQTSSSLLRMPHSTTH